MHGDQTGEELLAEALRILQPAVIRQPLEFVDYDLSLESRQASKNQLPSLPEVLAIRPQPQNQKNAPIARNGSIMESSLTRQLQRQDLAHQHRNWH